MASIWDFLDSLPKRSDVTPEELARRRQGYADLYQGGLLAGNRDQMPLSVRGAQATQDFLPVIGDALALGEAGEALSRGELAAAGLLGAGAAIGLVPGAGDALAKPVMAAGRKLADAIPSDALYAGRSLAEGDMRGVLDAFAQSRPAQGLGADAVRPALRVFHGTDAKINTLDPNFSRTARDLYTTPVRDDAAMYGKNVLEFDVSGSVGDFRADTRGSAANKIMKNVYSEYGLDDYFDSFDDFVDAFDSGDMYQRFGNSRAQDDIVAGLLDEGGFDAIRIPDAGFGGRMSESVVARDPSVFKSPAPAPQVGSGLLSDYVGQHRAPTRDAGAPAFNLAGDIYPDDIYSSKAVQYYGTGSDAIDKQTMGLLQSLRGKPDADVTIYRAVPKGVDNLNAGDWVTVSKQYAEDHGEYALGGDFDIIEKKVKAKDIFTNGDSIHEFGYDPTTPAQEVAGLLSSGRADEVTDEMLAKFTPRDEMELFDLYQRGATGMDLPMDEASRMARAGEMGFDVEKPRYHGSDLSLPYLNPDMGAGERYRTGVFSTDNPDVADSYVSKSGGTIYPMTTRRNDGGSTINAAGANWNKIPPSAPARIAGSALEQEFPELFGDVSTTAYDVAPSLYDDLFNSGASTNALAREKRFAGDSNITFENLVDRGPNIKRYLGETPEMQRARELSASQPSDVRVDFYGNQIRTPFARFDPRLAHLRNLSAGVGGLGLLSSMMPSEEQY